MPKVKLNLDATCQHKDSMSSALGPSHPSTLPCATDACPKCGGLLATRLNSFQGGRVLEIYCAICGKSWPMWGEERVVHHDKDLLRENRSWADHGVVGFATTLDVVKG